MKRRALLTHGLIGLTIKGGAPLSGGFADSGFKTGHALRDRTLTAAPKERRRRPVVIVGGGIAGLSAAWWMHRKGFRDFAVLELEAEAGGNSRSGRNEVSAFPWGAHYVPVPGRPLQWVHELFRDLGVLRDNQWDERWLCHSPQERLFLHGRWQESLEPHIGATAQDRADYRRFAELMDAFENSGRFLLPSETAYEKLGAADRDLDRLTMAQWLAQQGLRSKYLRWHVDYACRDDFGTGAAQCSAWAGIHYHAARGQEEDKGPLTWPEGNGWIVRRLLERLRPFVFPDSPALRIEQQGNRWLITTPQILFEAERVIFAAPMMLAHRIITPAPPRWILSSAPWLTANLTLNRWPEERGLEPAWDNVIYGSAGLGYVVATHQGVRSRPQLEPTVWTYYWALNDGEPAAQRQLLMEKDWTWWAERILRDLERAHPDIRRCLRRIDLFRNAHAMVRPTPGFLFDPERRRRATARGTLLYAHSDLSGFSLFEEAQYWGVRAAQLAMK